MAETMSYTIARSSIGVLIDASTVSAADQVLTLVKGTGIDRRWKVEVFNGSEEAITVTDADEAEFTLNAGSYATYFFQGADLEQQISEGGGGGAKSLGDVFFSAVPEIQAGCKRCNYEAISQSTYSALFEKIGHLYAKNSTDQTAAEGSGTFYIPDGNMRFARSAPWWLIADTAIDISTDQITVTGHGLRNTGEDNGRPIKLIRQAGDTPSLPTGTGYTEYDQNYVRVIDADTLELYASEAEAIDTSVTTGRVDWTDAGSGTFLLSMMGCYQDDALEEHSHVAGTGSGSIPSAASDTVSGEVDTENEISSNIEASNETRPLNTSFNMQIVVSEISQVTGEAYDMMVWDSGWVANSNWNNEQLPAIHNLGAKLPNLRFDIFLSETGSDDDAFLIDSFNEGSSDTNFTYYGVDETQFVIQTGSDGLKRAVLGTGVREVIDTQSWYYKVKVYKPEIFTLPVETRPDVTEVTNSQTLQVLSSEDTHWVDITAAGQITLTLESTSGVDFRNKMEIYNDSNEIQIVTDGTTDYWLEPSQRATFAFRDGSLKWVSFGRELIFDDPTNANAVDPSTEGKFPVRAIGQRYWAMTRGSSGSGTYSITVLELFAVGTGEDSYGQAQGSISSNRRVYYDVSADTFLNEEGTNDIHKMWIEHQGE